MSDEARDRRNVELKWQLEVTSHLLACLIVQNNHPTKYITSTYKDCYKCTQQVVICTTNLNTYKYGTCHKKLYEIRGLSASEIRSFSAASPRISTESCKGVHGIVQGCPRNRARVSAEL